MNTIITSAKRHHLARWLLALFAAYCAWSIIVHAVGDLSLTR